MSEKEAIAYTLNIAPLWAGAGTVLYIGAMPNRFHCGPLLWSAGHELTLLEVWPDNCQYYRGHRMVRHIVQGDVYDVTRLSLPHSEYDITFWWHGPEHVERENVWKILSNLESLTRRVIVLGCPWGRFPQGPGDNPYDAHLSTLYSGDFIQRGYEVRAFGRIDEPSSGHLVAWKQLSHESQEATIMPKMYRVLMRINHSGDEQTYEAGEEVNLDHLPEEAQQLLVEKGMVEPVHKEQRRATKEEAEVT